MNKIDSLIEDLKAGDSGVRNRAAIKLMDMGDPSAVRPLVEAILKPENINHRGTLVYALAGFDCSEHIPLLVNLVLTGNFEVSAQAYSIISRMDLSDEQKATISNALATFDKAHVVHEHNFQGFEELIELLNPINA